MTLAAAVRPMSEADLLRAVLDMARLFGWRAYHTHDSRHSAAGFPDLVLVRQERLIFAELKAQKGVLTPDQRAWMEDLMVAADTEVHVWRPSSLDSGAIEKALR